MPGRGRKGIGALLTIQIFFIFFGISLFLFLVFFTYNIRVSRTETIAKSRESLLALSIINNHYSYGENFAVSLANDTEKTNEEISNYIIKFDEIPELSETEMQTAVTSIYYYYKFGNAEKKIEYLSNGKCFINPLKCREYTYIIKLPIPQIYDGTNFVKEGLFMSFV
jgi:hypothetical protein